MKMSNKNIDHHHKTLQIIGKADNVNRYPLIKLIDKGWHIFRSFLAKL